MADERIVIHDQDRLRHRQTPRARTVLALAAIVLLPYFWKSHPLADKWVIGHLPDWPLAPPRALRPDRKFVPHHTLFPQVGMELLPEEGVRLAGQRVAHHPVLAVDGVGGAVVTSQRASPFCQRKARDSRNGGLFESTVSVSANPTTWPSGLIPAMPAPLLRPRGFRGRAEYLYSREKHG